MPPIVHRLLVAAALGAVLCAFATLSRADPAPAFAELLREAQQRAPRLAEADANVLQAQGQATQAAARPNPTASLESENFFGTGAFHGLAQAETTLSVGQPVELGGKRPSRIAAGRAGVEAARAQRAQTFADFAYDLAIAYAETEAGFLRVDLAREGVSLAQEDARAARALVDAGKESEVRALQTLAALAAARAQLQTAQTQTTGLLARLTALAGSPTPFTALGDSVLVLGQTEPELPTIDVLNSPSVVAARGAREVAARQVRVEQTRAVPDVTLSVGVRRLSGEGATAMVGGISAPLPLFDRNRGNVAAAQAQLTAADARLNAARLDAEADARSALGELRASRDRLAAARQGEETAAEAYRLTRLGYEGGKLPLIEVINARRALAEAKAASLEAELARIRAAAAIARLQGRPPFGAQ